MKTNSRGNIDWWQSRLSIYSKERALSYQRSFYAGFEKSRNCIARFTANLTFWISNETVRCGRYHREVFACND